jgi:hypothetical protein
VKHRLQTDSGSGVEVSDVEDEFDDLRWRKWNNKNNKSQPKKMTHNLQQVAEY